MIVISDVKKMNRQMDKLMNTPFAFTIAEDKRSFIFKQQGASAPTFSRNESLSYNVPIWDTNANGQFFFDAIQWFFAENSSIWTIIPMGKGLAWVGVLSGSLTLMEEHDYKVFRPLKLSDFQFTWISLWVMEAALVCWRFWDHGYHIL